MFSPQLGLREVFGTSTDVQELLQNGKLILDERWLTVTILLSLYTKRMKWIMIQMPHVRLYDLCGTIQI